MRILMTYNLPGNVAEYIRSHGFEVDILDEKVNLCDVSEELAQTYDGLICLLSEVIDKKLLDKFRNLKGIAVYAVGYNNIDIRSCTELGIPVVNTPDVLTDATADIAITLILMAMRRINEAQNYLRAGKFDGWKPDLLLGRDLKGKILGILGMGRIGKAVAKRAEAFGMKIIYNTKSGVKPELPWPYVSFETLLKESDVLSIHTPLTDLTRHLLTKKELLQMKKGSILINTARGPIVDESALVEVLKEGHLSAAGLDVYEEEPKIHPELLKLENVILLPHIGSATIETRTKMAYIVANSIIQVLLGEKPTNTVNSEVYKTERWKNLWKNNI